MVTVVKHEWHRVDSQFELHLNEELLGEIYPDLGPGESAHMLKSIEEGLIDIDDVMRDAYDNNIDLGWDRVYDDWITDRKGGYEVTYELSQ